MKCSILLLVFLVGAATAQYFRYPIPIRYPRFPIYPELGDEYAASLADAPVGTYSKNKYSASNGRGLLYQGDEVSGISLGRAKVGIYGNDRSGNRVPLRG